MGIFEIGMCDPIDWIPAGLILRHIQPCEPIPNLCYVLYFLPIARIYVSLLVTRIQALQRQLYKFNLIGIGVAVKYLQSRSRTGISCFLDRALLKHNPLS